MSCRAAQVYNATRGLVAFNLPPDAVKLGANQYGTRYAFPDGSTLRVGGMLERIEWRSAPGGPGAVRALWDAAHALQTAPVQLHAQAWRGRCAQCGAELDALSRMFHPGEGCESEDSEEG